MEMEKGNVPYKTHGVEGMGGNHQENCDDFGSFVNYSNNGDRNCFNRRQMVNGQW